MLLEQRDMFLVESDMPSAFIEEVVIILVEQVELAV